MNAFAALIYISLVAFTMNYGSSFFPKTKTVLVPIAMLSLLSLSAATMSYVFGFQPLQLFLEGKKKEALDLFLKTIVSFALVTIVLFFLLFSGLFGK